MKNLPNLLIVDDCDESLATLEHILAPLEVNLISARSGEEALKKSRGVELAVALLDVRMPGMDGFELAKKINKARPLSRVPIIFLTANYDTEVQLLSGYESGGGDFIKKPCNDHLLLSKIRVFLDIFDQKQLLIRDNLYLIKIAHQLEKIKTSHKKSEARDRSSIEELESSLLQQQGLRKYIEEVIEKERKAISRELHDDLGQELTAVRLDLAIIKDNCADPDMILKINKVSAHICKIIKSVQRLTLQLRPHILDDLGLESAIEWYTAAFAQRSNIKVYLQIEPEIACSHDISFTVFRIIQESLTNVVRHSKASRVDIMLHHKGHAIHLKIFDNGIGISEFEKRSNKSFGIISMKERAASLGGSLEIEGENGGGTLVKMIIPLNNGNQ